MMNSQKLQEVLSKLNYIQVVQAGAIHEPTGNKVRGYFKKCLFSNKIISVIIPDDVAKGSEEEVEKYLRDTKQEEFICLVNGEITPNENYFLKTMIPSVGVDKALEHLKFLAEYVELTSCTTKQVIERDNSVLVFKRCPISDALITCIIDRDSYAKKDFGKDERYASLLHWGHTPLEYDALMHQADEEINRQKDEWRGE